MIPSDVHDLTAAYALDALDPEERAEYEAHLPTCERCRTELSSFTEVTGALAVAASGPAASPDLRDRILTGARAEGATVVTLESRRRRSLAAVGAVAGIAAAAAIGLGIWAITASRDLDETRTALQQQQVAAAVLADPSARTVQLEAGNGRLVVDSEGRSVLVLESLDAAPAGQTYQVWVIEEDTPRSAGVFAASGLRTVIPVGHRVSPDSVVAVTVEPAGGSVAPTSDPVVASAPV